MGGLWMSRLLKHNLMDDVFNNENESFMQETRLIESEYSVNLVRYADDFIITGESRELLEEQVKPIVRNF